MMSHSPDGEGLDDVHLKHVIIGSARGDAEHAQRLLAKGGADSLLVVNAGDLVVAATDIARLECLDRLVRLELDQEDPLALDGLAPGREVLDELPRAEVGVLAGEVIEASSAQLLAVDGVVDGLVVRVRNTDVAGVRLVCVYLPLAAHRE